MDAIDTILNKSFDSHSNGPCCRMIDDNAQNIKIDRMVSILGFAAIFNTLEAICSITIKDNQ